VAVDSGQVEAALRRAGQVNALLGMDVDEHSGSPAELLDRPAAAELVDAVGGWLGTPERRVAASMVVLGYAARLVGPSMAVLVRDGILLDLRASRVRYAYAPQRGFRLTLLRPDGWRGTPEALRERWYREVVAGHLGSLIAAVRAVVALAPALLWGNVSAGLAGALRTLALSGAAPLTRCHDTGLSMLEHGPLRNTGRLWVGDGQLRFLRRSCCLFYRLDGGGMCGDCPLPARTGTS
jgi:ferric iron reductase protein FhuF